MNTVELTLPVWCVQYLMYGYDDNTTPEEEERMDKVTKGLRFISADTDNAEFRHGSDLWAANGDTVCTFTFEKIN